MDGVIYIKRGGVTRQVVVKVMHTTFSKNNNGVFHET